MLSRRLLSQLALRLLAGLALVALTPFAAFAVQEHGAPEGLYTHQGAHIFFMASMGLLIYRLRQRRLVRRPGWRYIQFAAFFFILWNIDAFAAHLLDEQLNVVDTRMLDPGTIRIDPGGYPPALAGFYYAAKLDHLLCVPALLFLYAGLRRLLKDGGKPSPEEGPP